MEKEPLFYFAPLEGISWYVYRNMQAKHFKAADYYVKPFIFHKILPRGISPVWF